MLDCLWVLFLRYIGNYRYVFDVLIGQMENELSESLVDGVEIVNLERVLR